MEESEQDKKLNEEEEEKLWSWGAGTEGQLGTGKLEDEHLPQTLLLPSLSAAGGVSLLSCGGAHVIALTSGGRVLTWGRGTSGQLGHGEMVNSLHPKPVMLLESYFITHVAAGWNHSGFVSGTGCLFTCGDGAFGQLGHGDYRSHCSPVKVSYFGSNHVEQIACGLRHSIVLLKGSLGHQVYGFGSGKRGQLGISKDKVKSIRLPQATLGFENVEIVGISANGDHSSALSADGHLYTWGRGFSGTSDAHSPQFLPSSLRFTKAAFGWNHALLLTDDRELFILGDSLPGVHSDPEKMSPSKHLHELHKSKGADLVRVHVLDGTKVAQIAAGSEHSAIVTVDGTIMTWGWGEHGQLGLGNTRDQITPLVVSLGHQVTNKNYRFKIYCGSGFTFVTRSTCLPPRS